MEGDWRFEKTHYTISWILENQLFYERTDGAGGDIYLDIGDEQLQWVDRGRGNSAAPCSYTLKQDKIATGCPQAHIGNHTEYTIEHMTENTLVLYHVDENQSRNERRKRTLYFKR